MILDLNHHYYQTCGTKGLVPGRSNMVQRPPPLVMGVGESRRLVRAGLGARRGEVPAAERVAALTTGWTAAPAG